MSEHPRPATPTVAAPRSAIDGACLECGARDLAAYRVMSEGGWWDVVKCQACLTSVERKPGPLLGALQPRGAPKRARPGGAS